MSGAAPTQVDYQGAELELFAHARRWKAYFAARIRPHLGDAVLEVGAGLGATTKAVWNGQSRWVCLEPDPTMAAALAAPAAGLPAGCRVEAGTVADLLARGEPAAFDSVLYIDVLEHIDDDADELARAARLLRPGGRLIVLSPAFQRLYTPFDAAIGHVRRYERAGLAAIAPRGLRPVTLRYLDSVGYGASLANRLMLRSAMPTLGQILLWDRVMVPLSRLMDPLVGYRFGRSILAVWQA